MSAVSTPFKQRLAVDKENDDTLLDFAAEAEAGVFPLSFSHDFSVDTLRCIEVEPWMLEELYAGNVELRGKGTEEVVLVTKAKTFGMRKAEFTNAELMVAPTHSSFDSAVVSDGMDESGEGHSSAKWPAIGDSISAMVTCHFELLPQNPRTHVLSSLLSGSHVADSDTSLEALKSKVQSSDEQLKEALQTVDALEVDGQWQLLEAALRDDCVSRIVTCVLEKQWPYDRIRLDALIAALPDIESNIVKHCLKLISCSDGHGEDEKEDSGVFALDESNVCCSIALRILAANGGVLDERSLLAEWSEAVPFGMKCAVRMLSAHAVLRVLPPATGRTEHTRQWQLFEERELSAEPKHRLEQMFALKPKWTKSEMLPYLEPKYDAIDRILLKHAKIIRERDKRGGVKLSYSSRRPNI